MVNPYEFEFGHYVPPCEVFDSCEDCPYWVEHSQCTWIPPDYVTVVKQIGGKGGYADAGSIQWVGGCE